jgi:predicted enzyme related to lactoylglutathione lyase
VSDSGQTRLMEVRTITVPVSDQQRALEFYTDTLGLETRLDLSYGEGQRWIEVAAPGATTTISLAPPDHGMSAGVDTGIRLRTGDAQASYDAFKSRGVPLAGEIMRWPGTPPMFTFRDQDGNTLYVVEEMAQTVQSPDTFKRFAVLVKSSEEVETGTMPAEQDLAAMSRFNDQLVESGAMLAGEGFHASSNGARLTYTGGDVRVQRGPFPDPRSLVAGYWMIQATSLDEAIDMMSRAPLEGGEVEIRQVFDAEEFGAAFTPELREREERQRAKMEQNARRRAA